ncbi:MAG TPA: YjbQ family protein, partial [Chloroflexi bacterium]|nr:YjbQ family protein [Chloroflexota bacterium]
GALDDLRRALDDLAPPNADYRHNLRWGDGNGHAHLRSALLKPSFSIPIVDGRLTLGTWQQIVFLDFDVRPRRRRLIVQIVGEVGCEGRR